MVQSGGRVGYELKRAEHALTTRMDSALREIGLTTPQYAALRALEQEPGLSAAAIARRCFVTPQTMSHIVANLESAGLVVRRPHPEHGRVLRTYMTRSGEVLVVQARGLVDAIEERMLSALSRDERSQLLTALSACADALGSVRVGVLPR